MQIRWQFSIRILCEYRYNPLSIAWFSIRHNLYKRTENGKYYRLPHPKPLWITQMNTLTEELKVKIIDILNLQDVRPEDFDENTQLVGGPLGIDSIDVLEMVVMVEKEYGVIINS